MNEAIPPKRSPGAMAEQGRRLWEVLSVFLKIGAVGFGAAAIWGLIQAEVQERRAWLTKERFLEGLALVNALPGAPAMQMCIFVGHQRAGWWGGLLAGLAFMGPAFAIVLLLSALASEYAALPIMRDAFYGLSPVVVGIFVVAVYRLGRTAIKDLFSAFLALAAGAAVAFSPLGVAGTLLLAACAGVAMHHSRRAGLIAAMAFMSPSWPGCPRRWCGAPRMCWPRSRPMPRRARCRPLPRRARTMRHKRRCHCLPSRRPRLSGSNRSTPTRSARSKR